MQHILHVDINDFFLGKRPWDELDYAYNSISSISGSHLWAATQDDEDLANAILELMPNQSKTNAPPPLVGWTAERADMAVLIDWAAISATGGGKKFKPVPRPKTAMERVREKLKDEKVSSVSAMLTGKG